MNFDEKIDISDLKKCADNFYQTVLVAAKIEADKGKNGFDYRFARSALIHVFEITVEASWKMMQRWIKVNVDRKMGEKPKRELFRVAHASGLISDAEKWWKFYDGRNKTSHTYHEEVAEEVYALAKEFGDYLKDFIERLDSRT